jgi:hypothetical protein
MFACYIIEEGLISLTYKEFFQINKKVGKGYKHRVQSLLLRDMKTCLPRKHEALSSNHNTTEKKKML